MLKLENTVGDTCLIPLASSFDHEMSAGSEAWKKLFGTSDAPTQSADSRASKRIAVNADASIKIVQERADAALRLATIATQKLREHEAVLCSSIAIKKSGMLGQSIQAAHAEYLKHAKGKKGHGLGDGSTFRFGAVLLTLASALESEELKAKFLTHVESYDPKGRVFLRAVKLCKTEVMHSSETVRFKLSIPSDVSLENLVIDGIEKLESAVQWVGPRPAGYLEQEAQKMLSPQ